MTSAVLDRISPSTASTGHPNQRSINQTSYLGLMLSAILAAPGSLIAQAISEPTWGQVWPLQESSLFAFGLPVKENSFKIELSAEEHEVFRLSIWDSVEVVAPGRFVEL